MKRASILPVWRTAQSVVRNFPSSRFVKLSFFHAPISALLLLLIVYRRLLMGWVIATGDLETYFYPYWVAVSRLLRSGKLPLWNPYLFTGVPLLANSQVGVFYPLNWPFWFLAGNSLQSVTTAIHASVLLHISLALLSVYYLGRKLGLSRWASALSGLVYAGSGFIGIHIEHLNQLQALAWMPLILLPHKEHVRRVKLPHPLSLVAMAMILLAGHTQMAFIAGVALILWRTFKILSTSKLSIRIARNAMKDSFNFRQLITSTMEWLFFFTPYSIAGLIAAVQLLPTLELVNYSARQAGLNWQEAVSFSLKPWEMLGTFLPPYISAPNFPESVAYKGGLALCLAGYGLWEIFRKRQHHYLPIIFLALSGFVFAFGGYNPLYLIGVQIGVPGLKHFRAPVRFLALYSLSVSLLTGLGFKFLSDKLNTIWSSLKISHHRLFNFAFLLMIGFELMICAEWLPHADATIPRAYTDLRPAATHLISLAHEARKKGRVPGRFISMSQMLFEIGDKREIESIYDTLVSSDALWSFFVSEKQRAVLTPNLPLAFQVLAADGYDGGLLPLGEYIAFSHILVDGGTTDGRLRENLDMIPDRRWLNLMDVRYIVTDKVNDTWVDDILYDRQFSPILLAGEDLKLAWLPEKYTADGIGLIYTGQGGTLTVEFSDGTFLNFQLPVMKEDKPYRIRWDQSTVVSSIILSTNHNITYKGISLINEISGSFYPLVLSSAYKLVHSGDVKIYEDTMPYGHAFFVPACQTAESNAHALEIMSEPAFNPKVNVVLENANTVTCDTIKDETSLEKVFTNASVQILEYDESKLMVKVNTEEPGFVVLSDAWYPGWHAQLSSDVDFHQPKTIPVLRGNLMFRAIPVPAGHWYITMEYQSKFILAGMILTGIGIILIFSYYRYFKTRKHIV